MNPIVKFTKINKDSIIPKIHTEGAAGYDLCSVEDKIVKPGESTTVNVGFFVELDPSLFGIIVGRSGISIRNGIEISYSYLKNNEPVVINVTNLSNIDFKIEKLMRIAQAIFIKRDLMEYATENTEILV